MAITINESFTSVREGAAVLVKSGDKYSYIVSGTFVATVQLESSDNGGQSWFVERIITAADSATVDAKVGPDRIYRFNCTAFTSGTAVTSVTEEEKVVQEFKNQFGNVILRLKEDSVEIPGAFVVTGNIRAAGGSAANPGFGFINDPDTGMFRFADNTIRMSTGATDRLQIASLGITVLNSGVVRSGFGSASEPGFTFDGDGDTGMFRSAANELSFSTGNLTQFKLTSSNSGIGTTNPQAGLHGVVTSGKFLWTDVETDATSKQGRWGVPHFTNAEEPFFGLVYASTSGANILNIGGGTSLGNAATELRFTTAATATTILGTVRMTIDNGGFVGIGENNPVSKLHIKGDGNADFNESSIRYTNSGTSGRIWNAGTRGDAGGGNQRFFISDETAAVERFSISSTGIFTGAATNDISDIRLKENIEPIENVLKKITNLRSVEFNFKENPEIDRIGVIAQEVEKEFPALVQNFRGYKYVNYSGLTAVVLEALRELNEKVNYLESQCIMGEQR